MRLLALAATLLHVTVWPQGMPGPSRSWTLRCGPPGGSLPRAAIACRRLAALDHPFVPTPPGTACSLLFVGAGRHQRRAIGRARERGLRVVAVDRDAQAPGLAEADVAEVVDFTDV